MTTGIDFRVDGQLALVTGAGRGLGRACALALAAAGAELVLVSRTLAEVEEVAAQIRATGGVAHARQADVTDADQVAELFATAGAVRIVLNNAGANHPQPFVDTDPEVLDRLLDLNVSAVFTVSQAAARVMVDAGLGGVILTMSSQLGHVGMAGRTVYTTTKHAVEGLTKAMALELAPHRIRVNTVAPTFVETPMTKPFMAQPGFRDQVLGRIPQGRLGTTEEVAAAVVYLASPAASLVTGTSLVVDGGWTAQ